MLEWESQELWRENCSLKKLWSQGVHWGCNYLWLSKVPNALVEPSGELSRNKTLWHVHMNSTVNATSKTRVKWLHEGWTSTKRVVLGNTELDNQLVLSAKITNPFCTVKTMGFLNSMISIRWIVTGAHLDWQHNCSHRLSMSRWRNGGKVHVD